MKLKQLFNDDDAVSPVIGVILMVAITVILAAVIGTFVLGLGDRVSEAQPTATFNFEYNTVDTVEHVNITHDGGDAVESSQLKVNVGGDEVWNENEGAGVGDLSINASEQWSGKISAGSKLAIDDTGAGEIDDGDTVKVIWTASGSDKTAVIGDSEVSL